MQIWSELTPLDMSDEETADEDENNNNNGKNTYIRRSPSWRSVAANNLIYKLNKGRCPKIVYGEPSNRVGKQMPNLGYNDTEMDDNLLEDYNGGTLQ